tara:strand:- start:865 stop:1020 length:156 start_codon:yes stop_codon:yes gene_type:complete
MSKKDRIEILLLAIEEVTILMREEREEKGTITPQDSGENLFTYTKNSTVTL